VRQLVPVKDKNGKSVYKEEHDFEFGSAQAKKRYKSDILPTALVIARYFAKEQAGLDKRQADYETATQELESFVEENSGEDGLIEEAKNDKGKVTKKTLTDRIKVSKDKEEIAVLKKCLELVNKEAACKAAVKTAKDALDKKVFEKIPKIPEAELKDIVVNGKWFASVEAQIIEEIERMTQQLANRVKTLEERYSETLPDLTKDVELYSTLVEGHLKQMGLSW
jgi:type I restriction enzyme M protein